MRPEKVQTDFRYWLTSAKLNHKGADVVYSLYQAIMDRCSNEFWNVEIENRRFYIWAPRARSVLLVPTFRAAMYLVDLLIRRVCEKYCGEYESMKKWYIRQKIQEENEQR